MTRSFTLLLILLFGFTIYAQKPVSGVVKSKSENEVLPGVSILIKGTKIGTQTDADGKFTINAKPDQILIFSFVGLRTFERKVNNESFLEIQLENDDNQFEEIVVLTALGLERKKDDDVSSSTLVNTQALKRSGESGVIQSLSGKTSGLTIVRNSGDPGAGAYIQIRGQNTITGSSSPLIILDGVPISNTSLGQNTGGVVQQSRLNDINPEDIENVTVLKGAAAAAVWGTGAANGVILIQTKKGKSAGKKVSIDISNQISFDVINREYDKQSTFGQGYPKYWDNGLDRDAYNYQYVPNTGFSWGPKIATRNGSDDVRVGNQRFVSESGNIYYPIIIKNDNKIYNDINREQVFQTGLTWNKSVGINLNNTNGSSFISFSDWDQKGIIKANSDYRRTTARFNNESILSDKLKIKVNTTIAKVSSNRIQQGSNLNGLYLGYLRTSPDYNNTDYKGTYYNSAGLAFEDAQKSYRRYLGDAAPAYNNPGWTINEQENPNDVTRFIINPELNWKVYKGISLTARYGLDYYNEARETYFPYNSAGNVFQGEFTRSEITEANSSFNAFLNSTHIISDRFNFSWILGTQFEQTKYSSIGGTSTQFTNSNTGDLRIFGNAEAANESPFLNRQLSRKSGAYYVINSEILNQVYLELTGRYELPSTLSKPLFYPSASLGWNLTDILPKNNILSFGKLRTSFGQIGIEPIPYLNSTIYGPFNLESTWGDNLSASAYGNPFSRGSQAGNETLKPEKVTEVEFGGDFRFLKERFSLGTTYYSRKTTDGLLPIDLSPTTGFASEWRNAATISNKGIEIDAGIKLKKDRNIDWRLDANFSKNKNIVENLSGVKSVFLDGFTGASSRVVEGYPFGSIWGGRWQRSVTGELILDENAFPIADEEEGVLGDPNPIWKGGLGSSISWKGLSLSMQFETMQGNKLWAGTTGVLKFFGIDTETENEFVTTEELRTYYGRTVAVGTTVRGNVGNFGAGNVLLDADWYPDLGGGFGPVAEQFVVDGSWTKLRELSINYSIPLKLLSKFKCNSASVGVSARNMFIWSKIDYTDPEVNLTGASKGRGLEYFTNPGTASYVVNFKLGF
jgi:TonB-linked SusC/RagA family outer membrane protein